MPTGYQRSDYRADTACGQGARASRQRIQRQRDQRQRDQRQRAQGGNSAKECCAGQKRHTCQERHTGEEHSPGEECHGGISLELTRLFSENRTGLGPHRARFFQTGGPRSLLQCVTDLVTLLVNRSDHRARCQAQTDQRGFR